MDESSSNAEWRAWFDAHAAKLWLFARQKARSEADAQDLMQEAIIEAAGRAGNNKPPAPALVFTTLRHRAIDRARQEDRRHLREQAVSGTAPSCWFDTGVQDRERARLIQEALQKLPEIYREVVTLKIWGELTFLEISQTLGIPANTVASRYRYGLQELRKLASEVFL